MPVIVDHIVKSFDKVTALSDVDFRVGDGELFGLIGPDGAGKSTLFRIVASLLVPDSGKCFVNGFDTVTAYREVRRIIGYMPGRFSLYMDLSVEENLDFYARVFGTTVQANYDLIREVYQQIEPFKKRLAGRLSGGMKQKLALSCALIHRPEVLILDEPTTGVDAVSRREFWEMLKNIRKEGITVVVSTPYMDEAALCDRVGLIQNGRILGISAPSDFDDKEEVPLFSLRCEGGVYTHLERIRGLEVVKHAWLFGEKLHVTLRQWEDAPAVEQELLKWKDPTVDWRPVKPTIEDRFMSLMARKNDPETGGK